MPPIPPTPEDRTDPPRALQSLGMRRHLMTGFLVQFFRDHFSDPAVVDEPSLRDVVWSPEAASAKITVDVVYRWDPTKAGSRPAVLIRPGDVRYVRLGIGDHLMGPVDDDGSDFYGSFRSCTHTIFCIANESGGVERLGFEVWRMLPDFGPAIRCALGFKKYLPIEMGAPAKLREAPDNYVVPVTIGYAWEECFRLDPQAPLLKRVQFGPSA